MAERLTSGASSFNPSIIFLASSDSEERLVSPAVQLSPLSVIWALSVFASMLADVTVTSIIITDKVIRILIIQSLWIMRAMS